jgi:uncharacterized membrane protein YcaP (DUF421 family)
MSLSDLGEMLVPTHSIVEMIVRGTIMYLAIFVLLRIVLKRRAQGVSTPDVLLVVMIADAAQNGMAKEYKSITEGIVLVSIILFWDWMLDWLSFRYPAIERAVRPGPLPLIENGRLNRRNMREELVTVDELQSLLREKDVYDIGRVKVAYLEPSGVLTVRADKSDD